MTSKRPALSLVLFAAAVVCLVVAVMIDVGWITSTHHDAWDDAGLTALAAGFLAMIWPWSR